MQLYLPSFSWGRLYASFTSGI